MNIRKINIEYTIDPTNTCVFMVVTDPMAGKRGRYTVHLTSLVSGKGTTVIGRELPLAHARQLVQRSSSNVPR